MFCSKCGKELNLTEKFCPKCGVCINQQSLKSISTKEDITTKPTKFKSIAIIGIVVFLVMIVVGSITFTVIKNSIKPERLIIGNWSMSNRGVVGQNKTTVEFTKDGKMITSNERKSSEVSYKVDSSDKKNIKLIIRDGSTDTKINLKFISILRFELSRPEQGNEVIIFRKIK